jgi:hypothetical protein
MSFTATSVQEIVDQPSARGDEEPDRQRDARQAAMGDEIFAQQR